MTLEKYFEDFFSNHYDKQPAFDLAHPMPLYQHHLSEIHGVRVLRGCEKIEMHADFPELFCIF